MSYITAPEWDGNEGEEGNFGEVLGTILEHCPELLVADQPGSKHKRCLLPLINKLQQCGVVSGAVVPFMNVIEGTQSNGFFASVIAEGRTSPGATTVLKSRGG